MVKMKITQTLHLCDFFELERAFDVCFLSMQLLAMVNHDMIKCHLTQYFHNRSTVIVQVEINKDKVCNKNTVCLLRVTRRLALSSESCSQLIRFWLFSFPSSPIL